MSKPQSPAVYALMKLHAELGGKISDNKRQAAKLRADMKHVEAVLHLERAELQCAHHRLTAAL